MKILSPSSELAKYIADLNVMRARRYEKRRFNIIEYHKKCVSQLHIILNKRVRKFLLLRVFVCLVHIALMGIILTDSAAAGVSRWCGDWLEVSQSGSVLPTLR